MSGTAFFEEPKDILNFRALLDSKKYTHGSLLHGTQKLDVS